MKHRILRLLARAGLIGPAFRVYERLVALRPSRAPRVEGPPLPPRHLMVRVAGTADERWFLESGRRAYDAIVAHAPLDSVRSVLDFGCGCGRVLRYWDGFDGDVVGSDLNADAVAWCNANLPFARVEVNALAPPVRFPDESLDLVYALSVFTHLTDELQLAWRDELRRVLRRGGRLLVTTHGDSYRQRLGEDERARYDRGELVVRWGEIPGTNLCSAYHPERYLRETFAAGFEFLELVREGAKGNPHQDLCVLRKAS